MEKKTGKTTFLNFNKKANSALDTLVIVVLLFAVGIGVMIMNDSLDEALEDFIADPDVAPIAKNIALEQSQNYDDFWDGAIMFAMVMLWLAGLITSFFIDSHPIFFVVTILGLIAVFYVGALMANEYQEFINEDEFVSYQANYPMTNWVMSNLLPVIIIMGFSFTFALYAKLRLGQ